MKASLWRVVTIARNTLTEALRQKVLNLLLLFGLVAIASANLFADLTFSEQLKFLKDFCLGSITLFGSLIALMGTAQLVAQEMETRTIYTILSKPVRRIEFLAGKFLGVLSLLFVAVSVMSLMFTAVLVVKEQSLIRDELSGPGSTSPIAQEDVAAIRREAHDPRLIQGLALAYAKVAMVAAIALVVSTFATSQVFTVGTTLLIYIIGHLQSVAREQWLQSADATAVKKLFLGLIAFLFPDFNAFDLMDDIAAGNAVSWAHTLDLVAYAGVYCVILLLVAGLIFQEKEF